MEAEHCSAFFYAKMSTKCGQYSQIIKRKLTHFQ